MLKDKDFDVQIAQSITAVDPATWSALVNGRGFTSHTWYRFGEQVLDDGKPVYIIIHHRGEPVAGASLWLTMQEPLPFDSALARNLGSMILQRWPVLNCRSPLRAISGLFLPDSPVRQEAFKRVIEAALSQTKASRASFLLFDSLSTQQLSHFDALTGGPAFSPVASEPGTILPIIWRDFDSYVKGLRKSARKDYRRHRNRAQDLRIKVTRHPTVITPIDQAMQLIHNVNARYGNPTAFWTRRMLAKARMVDMTWLTATIDDALVGCGLLLGDSGAECLALLGLDHDVNYVYFQLVYEAIANTIDKGARVLHGGREAYHVKARLNFQVEDNQHLMFTSLSPILRRAGQLAANSL